jgi:hypothetical protein
VVQLPCMYCRERFATRARTGFTVADYIEIFVRRWLHSHLCYRTPVKHWPTTTRPRKQPDQDNHELAKIPDTAQSRESTLHADIAQQAAFLARAPSVAGRLAVKLVVA